MNCVTVDEYVTVEEDLTTCFTFDGAIEANWRENLRTTAVSDVAVQQRDLPWRKY